MHLVKLIYTSEKSDIFQPDDIKKIIEIAKSNNDKLNITGALLFNRKFFVQCLEGERLMVNSLYEKIMKDPRHHKLLLIEYSVIHERSFASWSMGYIPEIEKIDALNIKYSNSKDFNPYQMTGESCHRLLMELRQNIIAV